MGAQPEPLLPPADEPRARSMFRVRDVHVLYSDQRWHDGRTDWRKYDPRLVHPR